ncbi:hypothetical protein SAMN05421736_11332 [Evansella caseinilytica]|uniref:Uncharacterized protein n=1 Tax=Evansella caseinilytica TaxID=1503961 RepID=A0A1H3T4X4_9BACI|nr:hypothetical protein SAMN05421736_11332 [Evansella caseinilytica]
MMTLQLIVYVCIAIKSCFTTTLNSLFIAKFLLYLW